MTDVFSRKKRSEVMSKIGPKTSLERKLSGRLRALGLKHGMHYKKLPGKPDIVFPDKKLAVFIDGCFWHKCPRHYIRPATRTAFWTGKIDGNVKRDRIVNRKLGKAGWRILRIWEHTMEKSPEYVVSKIRKKLFQRGA